MKLKNIFAKATMIMLVITFAISVFGSVVTMNQVNTPVLIINFCIQLNKMEQQLLQGMKAWLILW